MYAIIHPIEPFDTSIGTTIKFTWTGNQIYKVRCLIKNNETNVTVYDATVDSMKQSFTIPENSGLINGTYYVAYITVFDVNNKESDAQEIGTPFYCFSSPTFQLSIHENDVIKASSYKVGVAYTQEENELLDSYEIILYSYSKTRLQSSGTIYNTSDMNYSISGLENAKQYYIRAIGKTLHGIRLDTGYVLFQVSYEQAQVFSPLELNNRSDIGSIEIKSNIISALGLSEKDVVYINNDYADLRDNSVTWDVGFEIRGDFTMIYKFFNPNLNKSIIHLTGEHLDTNIYYRQGGFSDSNGKKAYFELNDTTTKNTYVQMTNYLDIPTDEQIFILLINRIGSLYDMKVISTEK